MLQPKYCIRVTLSNSSTSWKLKVTKNYKNYIAI
jgi:hypothetical protein